MSRRTQKLSLSAAFIALGAAFAHAAGPVVVRDAWVRATAPGQKVAGAYLELVSPAEAALTAVASPAAARVELHATTIEGGVMRMRPTEKIALPAGRAVRLAPGGLHVLLFDIKRPLNERDRVPLTLTIQRADGSRFTVSVEADVRNVSGEKPHQH
jgi:periplasmic copper chaperone A